MDEPLQPRGRRRVPRGRRGRRGRQNGGKIRNQIPISVSKGLRGAFIKVNLNLSRRDKKE